MPHRKLSDIERWQAIGLINARTTHRRAIGNLNCITMNLLTCDFDIAIHWPASAQYLIVSDVAWLC
jgi:hypothetical protein